MVYEIKSNDLTAKINTLGAELVSVVDAVGHEFIYQPTDLWVGQAKNQFPNVAVAKDDFAIMKGEKYPINQHGFLKLMEMEAKPLTESSIEFSLKSNEATRVYYPYEFEFVIRFSIEENELKQTYEVHNLDAETMYFGVSCHTGFYVTEESYVDMRGNDEVYEMLRPDAYLMSGEEVLFPIQDGKLSLATKDLTEGAHILKNFKNKKVTLVNPSLHTSVEFDFSEFPYFTLWSIGEPREFMCMMPWNSLPDYHDTTQVFSEKKGNISLEAGGEFSIHQYFKFCSE